jgi:hypothetical protein
MNPGNPIPARRTPPGDREKGGVDFTAPLGSATSGRLRFTNGAHRLPFEPTRTCRASTALASGTGCRRWWVCGEVS